MWQRFTLTDLRVIGHYLGVLIMLSSVMYLIPFFLAMCLQEWEPASRYLLAAGLSLVICGILRFTIIVPRRLTKQQALAVTGLIWIILALIASIPLFYSGHYATYLDALFDGVSGLTTTGASVICDLDHLSYADNMFRFMMHFAGGIGLIVVALSLGIFGKGGGSNLYSAEARSEHVVPNIVQTTRLILRITLVFIAAGTIILTILCLVSGMGPLRSFLHSLWLSISAFVTAGFTPTSGSVVYYHSAIIEFVLLVLMLCGAVNFSLHLEVWNGRLKSFFEDLEIRTMIVWFFALAIVLAMSLAASASFSDLPGMIRRGVFMLISASCTTGFQNITTNELTTVFSSGAVLVLAIAMAVGGGMGSTAGGIKLNRIGLIAKTIVADIKKTISPESARVVVDYNHLGRRQLTSVEAESAMTIFMLFVVTFAIGTLVGITYGYDALGAMFESISMASNGGLVTGIVSPGMPAGLEIVYILEMWAGRLEFITFLAIIVRVVVSIIPRRRARS